MSEQALKYRSFSGGKLKSLGFLCLSVKVIVSVAILLALESCCGAERSWLYLQRCFWWGSRLFPGGLRCREMPARQSFREVAGVAGDRRFELGIVQRITTTSIRIASHTPCPDINCLGQDAGSLKMCPPCAEGRSPTTGLRYSNQCIFCYK
jgi:hypothetical protein